MLLSLHLWNAECWARNATIRQPLSVTSPETTDAMARHVVFTCTSCFVVFPFSPCIISAQYHLTFDFVVEFFSLLGDQPLSQFSLSLGFGIFF